LVLYYYYYKKKFVAYFSAILYREALDRL